MFYFINNHFVINNKISVSSNDAVLALRERVHLDYFL